MRPVALLLWARVLSGHSQEALLASPVASAVARPAAFHRPPASQPLEASELAERLAEFWPALGREAASRRLGEEPEEEEEVEQVHLGAGGPGEIVVTFLTHRRGFQSEVSFAEEGSWLPWQIASGQVSSYSSYVCLYHKLRKPHMGRSPAVPIEELAAMVNTSAFLPETSVSYVKLDSLEQAWKELSAGCIRYKNPLGYYQSPYIHTVVLKDLEPRTTYHYRPGLAGREFKFTTPPAIGSSDPSKPFRLGVWADVGVTNVSLAVMKEMLSYEPELLLLVGDFSYADGWGKRWDLFGHMSEPLMSGVATLGVTGNHEWESSRSQAVDWVKRYPVPFRESGSETPMWYSYEAGLVHFLCLVGSYAPTDPDSPQYKFALQDLQSVNRARTPWLVVQYHTPWYNSNTKHYQEAYKAKHDMEDMFFIHGVDLVFNGHVHSYERSHPVYKDKVNRCGPTHIVIGDAGNYEGPTETWHEPQPEWSAFRESSFGGGLLTVHNGTHAEWEWRRAACVEKSDSQDYSPYYTWDGVSGPEAGPRCATSGDTSSQRFESVDSVLVVRDTTACPSRLEGRGSGWPASGVASSVAPAAATARRLSTGLRELRTPRASTAEQPPRRDSAPSVAALRPASAAVPAGVTRSLPRPPASQPLTGREAQILAASATGADSAARRLQAEDPVKQVHVGVGGPGEVVVTFLSWVRGLPSKVLYGEGSGGVLLDDQATVAVGEVSTYSTFVCPTNSFNLHHPALGPRHPLPDAELARAVNSSAFLPSTSSGYKYLATASQAWDALEDKCMPYKNPLAYHQAPFIHTVVLKGLKARTTYIYSPQASSRQFSFTTPPAVGAVEKGKPFKIGVWADVGITNISWTVMQQVKATDPELVLLVGDYSYADGWSSRWDVFGILMEPLMSLVPSLGVVGNHDVCEGRYQGVDWMFRYPMPHRESGSENPMWYSYNAGPVHIIGLAGSYAPTGRDTSQYLFVKEDLAHVDRTRTPWVVVHFHTPWYNSNTKHYQEAFKHQADMEELFYSYGVDLVFNGHVHSYERSHPVYNHEVDPCGTVHVVLGDAGNYEGPALPWVEPQPNWSAVRESAFGSGLLTVHNATHAEWAWHRAACAYRGTPNGDHTWWYGSSLQGSYCRTEGDNSAQGTEASDVVMLVRDLQACPNRALPLSTASATEAEWWSWALIGSALTVVVGVVGTMLVMSIMKSARERQVATWSEGARELPPQAASSESSPALPPGYSAVPTAFSQPAVQETELRAVTYNAPVQANP